MPPKTAVEWDARYAEQTTPWDSRLPSRELRRVLDEYEIGPGRVLELGCGSGTNAIALAESGFTVTALDYAPLAIEEARAKASAEGVGVEFVEADVCTWEGATKPFDFVFDRGCYHCVRSVNLHGYLSTLRRVTRPGTLALVLTGNANAPAEGGPPTVTIEELGRELDLLFEFVHVRRFHFEDAGGVEGPLGWSVLGRRRDE